MVNTVTVRTGPSPIFRLLDSSWINRAYRSTGEGGEIVVGIGEHTKVGKTMVKRTRLEFTARPRKIHFAVCRVEAITILVDVPLIILRVPHDDGSEQT